MKSFVFSGFLAAAMVFLPVPFSISTKLGTAA